MTLPAWLSAFITLLLVLDPVGNIPFLLAIMRDVEPARRWKVILRECAIALVVLFLFLGFGQKLLQLLGLSQSSLGIAGGIILFLIALRMVFESSDTVFGGVPQGEPFIVPLAIPFLAGPSALASVLLLGTSQALNVWAAGVLLLGHRIVRVVGARGVEALQRLMGLLLTAIAVEMFLRGVVEFMKATK
jgi:multiple antibiotic resistance protein